MQLNDFDNYAIRGLGVNGFTLDSSVINASAKNGTSAAVDEGSISFGVRAGTTGLTGTAASPTPRSKMASRTAPAPWPAQRSTGRSLRDRRRASHATVRGAGRSGGGRSGYGRRTTLSSRGFSTCNSWRPATFSAGHERRSCQRRRAGSLCIPIRFRRPHIPSSSTTAC